MVEGDTLVVTHIDRLSRGLTYGLQVIEGLHHAGVEFRSLSDDFDTSTATGKLQLSMVLAFSKWWRNSVRDRSVAGQAKARAEGRFPGRRPSLTAQQREYIRVERSKGASQRELAKLLEVSRWTIQQVGRVGIAWKLQLRHGPPPANGKQASCVIQTACSNTRDRRLDCGDWQERIRDVQWLNHHRPSDKNSRIVGQRLRRVPLRGRPCRSQIVPAHDLRL